MMFGAAPPAGSATTMRANAAWVIALSTMVTAACAGGAAQPHPSASAATTSGGPVAACVVGEWTSAQIILQASSPAGSAGLSGGSGIIVRVDPLGKTDVDFTIMEPAKFSATAGEAALTGQFRYSGHATGRIRTGDATATSGTWEPVGKSDFSDVRITVDLSDPVKIRPFDNVPITPLIAGDHQSGGAVEADPLLSRAQYRCGGNTLSLTKTDGSGLTWQLSRKP
jgi:hypothetical protein